VLQFFFGRNYQYGPDVIRAADRFVRPCNRADHACRRNFAQQRIPIPNRIGVNYVESPVGCAQHVLGVLESHGEQRMIGVGLLGYVVVLIVHVENDETIRIISMRKAEGNETNLYYENVGYF